MFEDGASDFNPDGVICLQEGWMLLSSHLNSDCHLGVRGGDAQMLISLDTLLGYWVKNIRHITEYSGPQFIQLYDGDNNSYFANLFKPRVLNRESLGSS